MTSEQNSQSTIASEPLTRKKRSFWVSRPATLLIIFCFFMPWVNASGCSTRPMSGLDLVDTGRMAYQTPIESLFDFANRLLVSLHFFAYALIPLGATYVLFVSFRLTSFELSIRYASYAIITGWILGAYYIFGFGASWIWGIDFGEQVTPTYAIAFLSILSLVIIFCIKRYESFVHNFNIKGLRRYLVALTILSGIHFTYTFTPYHNEDYYWGYYVTHLAVLSFLIAAYMSYKEGLPQGKRKNDEHPDV